MATLVVGGHEGREDRETGSRGDADPGWKLRPLQVAITLAMVLMLTVVAVALVVTGPVARAIGDVIGLGSTAVGIWNVATWPALVLIVMFTFALLNHTAPNVRPRRFRILTWGSAIAVLLWIAASAAFAVYVGNFSSYNSTYGSLGAVVVFLVWLCGCRIWPSCWGR